MAKRIVLIAVFLKLALNTSCAQQLIVNAGFEHSAKCPNAILDIRHVYGWAIYDGSPDYFKSCEIGALNSLRALGVPNNFQGKRTTFTGDAYIGLALVGFNRIFNEKTNYELTEGVYTKFVSRLQKGHRYQLSFFISLSDSSKLYCDSIYASFSINPPIKLKSSHSVVEVRNRFVQCDDFSCSLKFLLPRLWNQVIIDFVAKEDYNYMSIGLPRNRYSRILYTNCISQNIHASNDAKRSEASAYYYLDDFVLFEIN